MGPVNKSGSGSVSSSVSGGYYTWQHLQIQGERLLAFAPKKGVVMSDEQRLAVPSSTIVPAAAARRHARRPDPVDFGLISPHGIQSWAQRLKGQPKSAYDKVEEQISRPLEGPLKIAVFGLDPVQTTNAVRLLSLTLAMNRKFPVAAVDVKAGNGTLASYFPESKQTDKTVIDLDDAIAQIMETEGRTLWLSEVKRYVVELSNLFLVAGRESNSFGQQLEPHQIERIFHTLSCVAETIVVDPGAGSNPDMTLRHVMERVDKLVVVSDLSQPSINHTVRTLFMLFDGMKAQRGMLTAEGVNVDRMLALIANAELVVNFTNGDSFYRERDIRALYAASWERLFGVKPKIRGVHQHKRINDIPLDLERVPSTARDWQEVAADIVNGAHEIQTKAALGVLLEDEEPVNSDVLQLVRPPSGTASSLKRVAAVAIASGAMALGSATAAAADNGGSSTSVQAPSGSGTAGENNASGTVEVPSTGNASAQATPPPASPASAGPSPDGQGNSGNGNGNANGHGQSTTVDVPPSQGQPAADVAPAVTPSVPTAPAADVPSGSGNGNASTAVSNPGSENGSVAAPVEVPSNAPIPAQAPASTTAPPADPTTPTPTPVAPPATPPAASRGPATSDLGTGTPSTEVHQSESPRGGTVHAPTLAPSAPVRTIPQASSPAVSSVAAAPATVAPPSVTGAQSVSAATAATEKLQPTVGHRYLVQTGDTLWGIASAALARHTESRPTTDEINAYWRQIYAEPGNREVIGDNPDLILKGEGLFITLPHL